MTVGLIRLEAARDISVLAASGASRRMRRSVTAATAGGVGRHRGHPRHSRSVCRVGRRLRARRRGAGCRTSRTSRGRCRRCTCPCYCRELGRGTRSHRAGPTDDRVTPPVGTNPGQDRGVGVVTLWSPGGRPDTSPPVPDDIRQAPDLTHGPLRRVSMMRPREEDVALVDLPAGGGVVSLCLVEATQACVSPGAVLRGKTVTKQQQVRGLFRPCAGRTPRRCGNLREGPMGTHRDRIHVQRQQ